MSKLLDKVAIVTGGASGMGASHVRKLHREGAKVVITDILEKEGTELAKELGQHALFLKHDVTNSSDWENVITETEKAFGPVHILVNNAGISFARPIKDFPEDEFKRVIEINAVSVFLGMKAILPSMKKVEGGSIINISSINGLKGQVSSVAYVSSKFAVTGMTKVAALEYSEYGIRVNSIHPGIVNTSMYTNKSKENAEIMKKIADTIPLKRLAEPEDISNLVLYLASDDSRYSTGAEFVADGGLLA